jgi:hypothetical protein
MIIGVSNVTQISTGNSSYTCAVLTDQSVRCWQNDGELLFALKINDALQVSVGDYHACVLVKSGIISCWMAYTPKVQGPAVVVEGITEAVQVESGGYRVCALLATGTVSCWIESPFYVPPSERVPSDSGLTGVSSITVGRDHSCALLADSSVHCWGSNEYGQLGDGTYEKRDKPVLVEGVSAVQIFAGSYFTCAVLIDGSLKCWGTNDEGQLGNGTTESSAVPVAVVW